ncbi:MAG TPA: VWA domain-containing protein [Blastocatellia bacterium]|jgi:VWFA-related protein
MRRPVKVLVGSFAPLLALCVLAGARTQQKGQDEDVIKLNADLVIVDAQVLSRKTGQPVNGLVRENFTVYEDGVKQYIETFSQDRLPLSIVLLLDVSGSVQPVLNEVQDSGLSALKQLKPEDEIAVMAFGKWTRVIQDFTTDREQIIKQIGSIKTMGHWIREGTFIDEAIFKAAEHLRKASNPDSRRSIIVISDNLSNQPDDAGHSRGEAMQELLENGSVVSALIIGDFETAVKEYGLKGYHLADSIGPYVAETGGVIIPASKSDASRKLGEVIERLRTRYSLGYFSTNAKRDGKLRKISLKISPDVEKREGKIGIVTRKGYYAH